MSANSPEKVSSREQATNVSAAFVYRLPETDVAGGDPAQANGGGARKR